MSSVKQNRSFFCFLSPIRRLKFNRIFAIMLVERMLQPSFSSEGSSVYGSYSRHDPRDGRRAARSSG